MISQRERDALAERRREAHALLSKLELGEPVDFTVDGQTHRMLVTQTLRGEPVGYNADGSIMLGGSWESAHSVVLTLEDGTYTRRVSASMLVDWSTPPVLAPVWTDEERREAAQRRRLEALVVPGSRWRSDLSGRILVVLETQDQRVRWGYADDLEDHGWDELAKFADLFRFVRFGEVPDPLPARDA